MGEKILRNICLSCVLLLLFGTCSEVLAQYGGAQQKQQPKLTKEEIAAKRKKEKEKFKTTALKQLINIPNVPAYPVSKGGLKFVHAHQYSSLGKGDNCVVQTFLLRDPPDVVRDWYTSTLNTYQWTVQPANIANTQILGRRRKDGASVHIMISGVPEITDKKAGFKSQVQVRYVQWVPLPDNPGQ